LKLSEHIKSERFASAGHEAMLNVVVTSAWLLNELSAAMSPFGVTPAQFNVLRILKGSHPEALTCSEIGNRLLDRTPDVTRLLNRLEKNGLITRTRAEYDRRVVRVGIAVDGLRLLEEINPVVAQRQEKLMSALTEDEKRLLSDMLDRLRSNNNE
jgi:DNA-binding MarR family transcriptional regulator